MTKPKPTKPDSNKTPNRLLELVKRKQSLDKGNGVLGKDLSSQFSSRSDRNKRPTKRGGRNGQGKP